MKKIMRLVAFAMFTSGLTYADINPIRISPEEKSLIQKFRYHHTVVWYMQACAATGIYTDYHNKYIGLHHLSGNVQHILNIHNDEAYCEKFIGRKGNFNDGRERLGGIEYSHELYYGRDYLKKSFRYMDIAAEHNPEQIVREILSVMKRADQDINRVSSQEVMGLEQKTIKYGYHRKMFNLYRSYAGDEPAYMNDVGFDD